MPEKSNQTVLDTSALLSLIEDEDGAAEVEKIIREDGRRGKVFISFMSPMEFYYINHNRRGEAVARERQALLKELPLAVVESDEALGLTAGRIKALNRLSVADAWVAATAERLGAVLVHKDPEFEVLKDSISLHHLPYKAGK